MGGPQGRGTPPRQRPNLRALRSVPDDPRKDPDAIFVYDSARGVHSLITEHANGSIRATCSALTCHEEGQWHPVGPAGYVEVKADFDKQHNGGKR